MKIWLKTSIQCSVDVCLKSAAPWAIKHFESEYNEIVGEAHKAVKRCLSSYALYYHLSQVYK